MRHSPFPVRKTIIVNADFSAECWKYRTRNQVHDHNEPRQAHNGVYILADFPRYPPEYHTGMVTVLPGHHKDMDRKYGHSDDLPGWTDCRRVGVGRVEGKGDPGVGPLRVRQRGWRQGQRVSSVCIGTLARMFVVLESRERVLGATGE